MASFDSLSCTSTLLFPSPQTIDIRQQPVFNKGPKCLQSEMVIPNIESVFSGL
jgi:hypothetical protein